MHVWEDSLWRLSISTSGVTTGFAYLEPKRHIPHITDLSGEEAVTFGLVLAPHRTGDALKAQIIRGRIQERKLPSGATDVVSLDFPELPIEDLQAVIDRTAQLLS